MAIPTDRSSVIARPSGRGNLTKRSSKDSSISYYVYILANNHNNVIYTGVTNDLRRRVFEHKSHIDPDSFTSRYHVDKLVYYEEHKDPVTAITR